jgi:multicomponent K+:H+ antiporter subunit A
MLLALNFLPKTTPKESSGARRLRDGVIAGAAGLAVAGLAYAIMLRDSAFPSISDYHLANAKTLGGGTNVVNVILVDFRGYDTFGEILVLAIAGLVIFALADALLRGPAGRRLMQRAPDQSKAGDRHPMMLVVATRLALPIVLVVGIYIFLRGHNEPGGGFIAGLVVAIAILMQYMASGLAWAEARQRADWHAVIAMGALIAAAGGIGSFLADRPFLTSNFGYFRIPPFDKFELATAMIFDLGVFLVVVGTVMLVLSSISRLAIRGGTTVACAPLDIDPSTQPAAREA